MLKIDKKLFLTIFLSLLFTSCFSIGFAQDDTSKTDLSVEELNKMSLADLLDIRVVTASKSSEKQSEAPGVISVFTKDEIERFGGQTLHEILERIPGIIGTSSFMTEQLLITPRGDPLRNSGAHVLLLIDGRPLRESYEGGIKSEVLATFPVEIIERIEVVKGPGSVLYGSTAFTAVINVITVDVEDDGLLFNNFIGQNDAFGSSMNLHFVKNDLKILAAGKYDKKANWNPRYFAEGSDQTLELDPTIPNTGFGTFFKMEYKNFSITNSFNKWRSAYILPSSVSNSDARWEKIFLNTEYKFNIMQNWNSSISATFTNSKFVTDAYPYIHRNSYDLTVEYSNKLKLSDKSLLVFGALYNRIHGKENINSPHIESSSSLNDYGIYFQAEYKLFKNLNAVLGAQLNKIENTKLDLVPRIGLIWQPSNTITLKALYGQAFRAPSINELNTANPLVKSNPDLQPEKVGTYDFEVSYNTNLLQASVNFFHTTIRKGIYFKWVSAENKYTYDNGESIETYGGEFETKFFLEKNLFFTGSILLQKGKTEEEKSYSTSLSNFGAKGGISYIWNEMLTLSFFDIYYGAVDADSQSPNPGYGSYNILNFYSKVKLNGLFKFNSNSPLFLTLEIKNLFDKEIWVPAVGTNNTQSVPYKSGRAIYGGIQFEF